MIILAHNGVDDGHPDATTSPSIGMPPAPPAPNHAAKNKDNAPIFLLATTILLLVLIVVFISMLKRRKA
jgi:hypothetical protein